MCKIVPRYALHHRVASSPPALFFLSLSFGSLLSPLCPPSFAFPIERVSSGYCQLAALLAFFSVLFPSILFASFFLITVIPFFTTYTFFLSVCISCTFFLRFLYFTIFLFSALIFRSPYFFFGSFISCEYSLLLLLLIYGFAIFFGSFLSFVSLR